MIDFNEEDFSQNEISGETLKLEFKDEDIMRRKLIHISKILTHDPKISNKRKVDKKQNDKFMKYTIIARK